MRHLPQQRVPAHNVGKQTAGGQGRASRSTASRPGPVAIGAHLIRSSVLRALLSCSGRVAKSSFLHAATTVCQAPNNVGRLRP